MAGLMDKIHKMWGAPEDEYEYEDYPEEEAQPEESNGNCWPQNCGTV